MDLGVFIPISNNGWIVSSTSPQYMPSFALNNAMCQEAERGGLDFALSMVKFRGYGGRTEHWDYGMDSFSLMAGLAVSTSRLQLYASVAAPTMHPAMTARMAATIDDISGGRFGVNIVSGWNKYEYAQMGLWPGDDYYNARYDYSTEYVEVMRQLWESGQVTYEGKYFHLEDCFCKPLPQHRIPVVCAGQSKRGLRFTAEVGDLNFMLGDLEQCRTMRDGLNEACATTGRQVGAYALFGIVAAETEKEARDQAALFLDGVDDGAIDMMARYSDNDPHGTASGLRDVLARVEVIEGNGSRATYMRGGALMIGHLVGTYEQIAAYLDALEAEAGMSGVVMTFPECADGVTQFCEEIQPLMSTRS
jgi:pyrimidine oxygenase